MDLLLQLQSDLAAKINSETVFQYNFCTTLRSLVVTLEIAKKLIAKTLKGGKLGCGIIVNMPVIYSKGGDESTLTPIGDVAISLDVIENPELNFGLQGSQITCEQTARAVRAFLHGLAIDGLGSIYQDVNAVVPIQDIESFYPGCAGYRCSFRMTMPDTSYPQVASVGCSDVALLVTLTCATGGAAVYYTTDGSFPGAGVSTATLYSTPFTVMSGTIVRAAAYLAGYIGSTIASYTIST